jgi:hypothetical protein
MLDDQTTDTDKLLSLFRSSLNSNVELFYAMKGQWTSEIVRIFATASKMPSDNMRDYYLFILKMGKATNAEISREFKHKYFNNSSKYICETLGRMVKNGYLIRPKNGLYVVSVIHNSPCKKQQLDPCQLALF